ncbi:MAG: hypothetical protein GX624_09205 [Actinobacteria bacterium]|nr:hypothetical protein [Actinomycetota bacterium]
MIPTGQDRRGERRLRAVPRRIHFITDADCGYTLQQIRAVPDSDILYAELHQRPTDGRRQRALPALAIMRSPDELPTVGRAFTPEILADALRGTAPLHTGRVEIVWEEPPSGLLDEELRQELDDLLTGRLSASECVDLRARLVSVISSLAARVEQRRPDDAPRPDWEAHVDDDLAGVPAEWVEDLAAARQALHEIDDALAMEHRGGASRARA